MHLEQRIFVDLVRAQFPAFFRASRTLEVGSYDVNGSIRSLFEESQYLGIDISPGPGVDVIAFGHEFTCTKQFDIAISCECFEHDPFFLETFVNMVRLTRPGGLVVFTCATDGRPEHGTTRSSPESSPGSVLAGFDYYRNVRQDDFATFDFFGTFAAFRFFHNPGSKDLYFIGMKRPGAEDVEERLENVAAATQGLTRFSVNMAEADRLHASGEPGKAADLLNALIESDNREFRARALQKQIWFLIAAKRFDAAEQSSDLLLSVNDLPEYHWQRSVLMNALGRNEAAIAAIRVAIERDSNNSQFQQHLGTLLLAANKLDEAEQAILTACKCGPTNALAHHRLSILRLRQRRLDEAIVAGERAASLAPDDKQFSTHLQQLRALASQ